MRMTQQIGTNGLLGALKLVKVFFQVTTFQGFGRSPTTSLMRATWQRWKIIVCWAKSLTLIATQVVPTSLRTNQLYIEVENVTDSDINKYSPSYHYKKMFKCAIAITSPNPGWEHDFSKMKICLTLPPRWVADCGFVPFPKYFEKKFRPASYRIPNSTWRI